MSEQILLIEATIAKRPIRTAAEWRAVRKTDVKKGRFRGHKPALLSLVGRTFGNLTVTKFIGIRRHRSWWECECLCGTTKEVRGNHLTFGQVTSCGCQSTRIRTGPKSHRWAGCGEISGGYYSMTKHGAAARGLEFSVTLQEMWDLFLSQDRKCALSGVPINFSANRDDKGTASIDRIDSAMGYVRGNVQWLHKDVNRMKMDFTQERFVWFCTRIAERKHGI